MPLDESLPINKFKRQRQRARDRGIGWELTFEQWWQIWQDSGKWELRGVKYGHYVMSRRGDVGPYSADNVFICPVEKNHTDATVNGRRIRHGARGWTYTTGPRPYRVCCAHKYIGAFATQEEAEAAYRAALCRHQDAIRSAAACTFF